MPSLQASCSKALCQYVGSKRTPWVGLAYRKAQGPSSAPSLSCRMVQLLSLLTGPLPCPAQLPQAHGGARAQSSEHYTQLPHQTGQGHSPATLHCTSNKQVCSWTFKPTACELEEKQEEQCQLQVGLKALLQAATAQEELVPSSFSWERLLRLHNAEQGRQLLEVNKLFWQGTGRAQQVLSTPSPPALTWTSLHKTQQDTHPDSQPGSWGP